MLEAAAEGEVVVVVVVVKETYTPILIEHQEELVVGTVGTVGMTTAMEILVEEHLEALEG